MITYREAQESDLVKLLKMWKNFQDEQMNYFKKYSKFKENVIEITKDFFLETMNLKKGLIYLAIDNKKIIGFVLARVTDFYPPTMKWKKEGKINNIIVKENYQGKGIGKSLFKYAEAFLKENGAEIFSVVTRTQNSSIEFYEKMGLKQFQVRLLKVF
jgi:ribosomal protein S18 acetylase RimI-like enzyme